MLREGDLHVRARADVLGGREADPDGGALNAPNDLTAKEQRAIRATLHVLRLRVRSWKPLGKTLRYEPDTLSKIASGGSAVTPTLAVRLARHLGVTMEGVLAGECCRPERAPTAATGRMTSTTRRRRHHDTAAGSPQRRQGLLRRTDTEPPPLTLTRASVRSFGTPRASTERS